MRRCAHESRYGRGNLAALISSRVASVVDSQSKQIRQKVRPIGTGCVACVLLGSPPVRPTASFIFSATVMVALEGMTLQLRCRGAEESGGREVVPGDGRERQRCEVHCGACSPASRFAWRPNHHSSRRRVLPQRAVSPLPHYLISTPIFTQRRPAEERKRCLLPQMARSTRPRIAM